MRSLLGFGGRRWRSYHRGCRGSWWGREFGRSSGGSGDCPLDRVVGQGWGDRSRCSSSDGWRCGLARDICLLASSRLARLELVLGVARGDRGSSGLKVAVAGLGCRAGLRRRLKALTFQRGSISYLGALVRCLSTLQPACSETSQRLVSAEIVFLA